MQSDQNLLYGMLAYQTGYINKDQLVEAMHAWTEAKQKSIGSILVDRGFIQLEDRQDIDKMTARKLEQFGNDVAKTLASIAPTNDVCASLGGIHDADISESLGHVGDRAFDADDGALDGAADLRG